MGKVRVNPPSCKCGKPLPEIQAMGTIFRPVVCLDCGKQEIEREEQEERESRVPRLLDSACPSGRLRDLTLASHPDQVASDLAYDWWWANEKPWLYVHGPVGTGKTGLAWGLVKQEITETGRPAKLVSWRDYLSLMKDTFDTDMPVDRTPRYSRFLCLDDVGAERPTEWAVEELAVMVEWRYERRLRTIITSNYHPLDLMRRIGDLNGERIVSRILEECDVIKMGGANRRL